MNHEGYNDFAFTKFRHEKIDIKRKTKNVRCITRSKEIRKISNLVEYYAAIKLAYLTF